MDDDDSLLLLSIECEPVTCESLARWAWRSASMFFRDVTFLLEHDPSSLRPGGHGLLRNLVDPASSHMLVSKIKPCMSQYKLLYGETANGSLKQL